MPKPTEDAEAVATEALPADERESRLPLDRRRHDSRSIRRAHGFLIVFGVGFLVLNALVIRQLPRWDRKELVFVALINVIWNGALLIATYARQKTGRVALTFFQLPTIAAYVVLLSIVGGDNGSPTPRLSAVILCSVGIVFHCAALWLLNTSRSLRRYTSRSYT